MKTWKQKYVVCWHWHRRGKVVSDSPAWYVNGKGSWKYWSVVLKGDKYGNKCDFNKFAAWVAGVDKVSTIRMTANTKYIHCLRCHTLSERKYDCTKQYTLIQQATMACKPGKYCRGPPTRRFPLSKATKACRAECSTSPGGCHIRGRKLQHWKVTPFGGPRRCRDPAVRANRLPRPNQRF